MSIAVVYLKMTFILKESYPTPMEITLILRQVQLADNPKDARARDVKLLLDSCNGRFY